LKRVSETNILSAMQVHYSSSIKKVKKKIVFIEGGAQSSSESWTLNSANAQSQP